MHGNEHTVRFGRLGTAGQIRTKTFPDPAAAGKWLVFGTTWYHKACPAAPAKRRRVTRGACAVDTGRRVCASRTIGSFIRKIVILMLVVALSIASTIVNRGRTPRNSATSPRNWCRSTMIVGR